MQLPGGVVQKAQHQEEAEGEQQVAHEHQQSHLRIGAALLRDLRREDRVREGHARRHALPVHRALRRDSESGPREASSSPPHPRRTPAAPPHPAAAAGPGRSAAGRDPRARGCESRHAGRGAAGPAAATAELRGTAAANGAPGRAPTPPTRPHSGRR